MYVYISLKVKLFNFFEILFKLCELKLFFIYIFNTVFNLLVSLIFKKITSV
jgi:hypothetical protein